MVPNPPPTIDRAQRFPIVVPVHYRTGGSTQWLEGRTVNISRTGVLFNLDGQLPAGSELEAELGLRGVTLSFRGTVVRSMDSIAAVKFHRHAVGRAMAGPNRGQKSVVSGPNPA